MTQDDTNDLDLGKLIIENSQKMNEFLKKDYEAIKNSSKSSELNKFWNKFEKKLKSTQKNKSTNQIFKVYIKLSDSRPILINNMDIIEPWFVKVEGINCKNGLSEKEVLNSRNEKPEIMIGII